MKTSPLDFLADFEKRLSSSIRTLGSSAPLEFNRLLNFAESTMLLRIGWPDQPLGRLTCRMVEEPQDFYFRGVFQQQDKDDRCLFTIRPGRDYDKDINALIDNISIAARDVLGIVPEVTPPVFVIPDFPDSQPEESFNPEALFAQVSTASNPPDEPPANFEIPNAPDPSPDVPTAFAVPDFVQVQVNSPGAAGTPFGAKPAATPDAPPPDAPAEEPIPASDNDIASPAVQADKDSPNDSRSPEEILGIEVNIKPSAAAPPKKSKKSP